MMHKVPELLAPAGSLEKLKFAILYGANAVYLGGQKFGLRSAASNFTNDELEEAVEFAHARGAKVYVVLNSFLHDKEIEELPEFVSFLEKILVDAVIISDMGVMATVSEISNLRIHLSTQASCLNLESAKLWKKMGVERVVLGREVSIEEASKIKKYADIEVEIFIHGSMCMGYSGNCVISNYTFGRDSNRGGCAHSCRFKYSLHKKGVNGEGESKEAFFMSSRDLKGMTLINKYIECEIDSLKIEGRMKGHLYVGTITKAYSDALRYYQDNGSLTDDKIKEFDSELYKVTHRKYSLGSLEVPAGCETIYGERETEPKEYIATGFVLEVYKNEFIVAEVRSAFNIGDTIEVIPFKEKVVQILVDNITDISGEKFERTRPGMLVKLPYVEGIEKFNMIRKKAN